MTTKEAIFYLKQVREDYEYKEFVEGKEALDLALRALRFANDIFPHTFQKCCEDWEKENG